MAVARTGGSGQVSIVWLIVFVVLWVASTTVAVIVYTGQEQVKQEAEKARRDKDAIAKPADISDPLAVEMRTYGASMQPTQSLVRAMINQLHAIAGRITGDATHSPAVAEAQLDQLLGEIRDSGVIPNPEQLNKTEGVVRMLQRVFVWYAEQNHELTLLKDELKKASEQAVAAQTGLKAAEDAFEKTLGEIRAQVDELAQSKSSLETTKSQELEALSQRLAAEQESLGTLRQEMNKQAAKFGAQIKAKDDVIGQQLARIGDVRGPGPVKTQDMALAREAAGRILRALPGDSLVHIDLGEMDAVSLGMRFSVYSAERRIPMDGRGKATIEIVNVGPYTSECRVITPPSPDDPILEEDLVQNIILARNKARKQQFVVLGTFDLDYDGKPDAAGTDKVKAYIERFGGEVADGLDAATDFCVVGRKPAAVEEMRDKAVDPNAKPANRDAAKASGEYEDAVRRAEVLGVPRLRQEVFLNFVGLEPGPGVSRRMTP